MNKNISYTDQELIELCLEGKEMGYSKMYEKYAKQVYNSIARLVIDDVVVEELTQELFITVFSAPNKLKEINYLGSWFKKVAINKALSHLRKKKIYFSEIDEMHHDFVDEVLDDVNYEELKAAEILKLIELQSVENRTILNLFLFENMSHEEIGNLLGISSNTVRSKYHRAKKKIVESLQIMTYD